MIEAIIVGIATLFLIVELITGVAIGYADVVFKNQEPIYYWLLMVMHSLFIAGIIGLYYVIFIM